jgi:hypothetical protein
VRDLRRHHVGLEPLGHVCPMHLGGEVMTEVEKLRALLAEARARMPQVCNAPACNCLSTRIDAALAEPVGLERDPRPTFSEAKARARAGEDRDR